jgi:DeoR family fructose operon transcriptional repressor
MKPNTKGRCLMFAAERKNKIIAKLKSNNRVKVADLSAEYGVSEATIRRDLQELEDSGLLRRTHGGAVLLEHTKFEPTFTEKEAKYLPEKQKIGKLAASLIEDGDTVILDSGTTTLYVAKNIRAKNVTVVTNSLSIMNELGKRQDIELISLGGNIRWETQAFVGPLAENTLKTLWADKVFLGTNGISIEHGITTPPIIEAQIKRIMIERSNQVIVTSDSSKFNKVTFAKISDINHVDVIVTDAEIDKNLVKEYKKKDIKILISQ